MDAFSPRPNAHLDYWFWKFHAGDLAFLVDLIVRRQTGLAEVRVSQWLRGVGRVVHTETSDWSTSQTEVRIGRTTLQPGRCSGSDDIVWPHPSFTGSVQVGAERYELSDLPGTSYHYWGRRLADRWIWLSATHLDGDPDRRVEGLFAARSRLYGRVPVPLPVSLLWTIDGDRREELVSAVNAMVRVRADRSKVSVEARGILGARHRLIASWGDVEPNDIGEGIIQTMHADLMVDGVHATSGMVGLEVRGYPHPLDGRPG